MITFERTFDWELIRDITLNDFVWSRIRDDFSPPKEQWEPSEDPSLGYVLVKYDAVVCGLFICAAESPCHYCVHTRLLPICYGAKAREIGRAFLDWLWKNGQCQRLSMNICETNRIAIKMAQEMGFKIFGINERSFMKHGKLQNQVMLGLSRPEGM